MIVDSVCRDTMAKEWLQSLVKSGHDRGFRRVTLF